MKLDPRQKKSGFTLIEMVIAVALVGLLLLIVLPNFLRSQMKSRDARRKADLGLISEALEEYRFDYGAYPTAGPGYTIGTRIGNYLKNVPADPKTKLSYCYMPTVNNLSYTLSAVFELEASECPGVPTSTPTPTSGPAGPTVTPSPTVAPTATPTPTPGGCSSCVVLNSGFGGSCCNDSGDKGLYPNKACTSPAAGNANYSVPPVTNCVLPTCPYTPPNPVWRRISDPDPTTCSSGAGLGVWQNCSGPFGCGAVTSNCNPSNSSPYCPPGQYVKMGCICF